MPAESAPAAFAATHWSTVLNAGTGETPEAMAALERLCSTYWFPIYAAIRRHGHRAEEASDLTQGFFESLLRRHSFSRVGPEKGRFRTFLLTSLGYFLADEAARRGAIRRGGGRPLLELDALDAEARLVLEPATEEPPGLAFDRRWALALMTRAVARLEAEQTATGRNESFARLKPFLGREAQPGEYDRLGIELGISANGVAAAVRRLRLRLRDMALAEAAETVASPADAEAELLALLQ